MLLPYPNLPAPPTCPFHLLDTAPFNNLPVSSDLFTCHVTFLKHHNTTCQLAHHSLWATCPSYTPACLFLQSAGTAKIHICYATYLSSSAPPHLPTKPGLFLPGPPCSLLPPLSLFGLPRALGPRIIGFGGPVKYSDSLTPIHPQALTKASGRPGNATASGCARVYPTTRRRFCAHPAAPPWTQATAIPRRHLHPYPYQEMKEAVQPLALEVASCWRGQGTLTGHPLVSAPQQQVDSSAVHCCSAVFGLVGAAAPLAARGDLYAAR